MARLLRKCYTNAMNSYDVIYDEAIDNYGIITSSKAKSLGVSNMALVQLARRGRLVHLGRGIYRLAQYVPSDLDDYAHAVTSAGKNAFLYGESVLALLGLAPTNPSWIYVASPMRSRRKLPPGIILRRASGDEQETHIEGIACQRFRANGWLPRRGKPIGRASSAKVNLWR